MATKPIEKTKFNGFFAHSRLSPTIRLYRVTYKGKKNYNNAQSLHDESEKNVLYIGMISKKKAWESKLYYILL